MTGEEHDWRFEGRRPSLPIPFVGGLALWAGCAGAYTGARGLSAAACAGAALVSILAVGGIGMFGTLVYFRKKRVSSCEAAGGNVRFSPIPTMLVVVICMLLLGCAIGMGQGYRLHALSSAWDGAEVTCEAVMLEDSTEGAYGENCLVSLQIEDGQALCVSARLPTGVQLLYGEHARVIATLAAIDPERSDYDWTRGCSLTAKVKACDRSAAPAPIAWLIERRSSAIESLDDGMESGALLQALVCGYRRGIKGTDLYASFQTCGLAHLIAVSGAHLVIVTSLIASVLRALRAPRKLSVAVLVAVMASYLVFSGAPISAIRATIMSSVGIMALFARRRPSSLSALGLCLIALLCASPSSAVSLSLALSALSTIGIVVFSPLFGMWICATPFGRAKVVSEPLVVTLSAAVLSQPLACALFAKLPLVSPIANIVCAPLFPLCCASGLVCAVLAASPLQMCGPVFFAAKACADLMRHIVGMLALLPYASVPVSLSPTDALVASALAGIVFWYTWSGRAFRNIVVVCSVPALVALAVLVQMPGDRIVMLDVGQGDAFLLQSRGQTLLIDTGNQDTKLLKGLGAHGFAHIDSVLVTHADDDHCGSLDAIASSVDVDRVLVAKGVLSNDSEACINLKANAEAAARSVVELELGQSFKVGAFTLTVVWPHELTDDAGNADSICLIVEYDGDGDGAIDANALFTGDAEHDQIERVLQEGAVRNVDLLKVGHHGSRNALTDEEASVLSPRIALIGVGEGNRYGHPTQETLAMLEDVGASVYRTDHDGETVCEFMRDAIRVSCAKGRNS